MSRPLAVSGNGRYTYDPTKPVGERIAPGGIRIGNRPVNPHATYRIATANNLFREERHGQLHALFGSA
ncbi:5'-nucleotidase C-terminal domain-containing protein [Micromonospora echinospora]|uniref:5'-nucleotidase C-terminal domain-containing protein n=1 Tax=Micromonospora echinospora TaxID=1877 RepID=UPI0033E2696F